MSKVEEAKVEGLDVKAKEDDLDEILEETIRKSYQIIDAEITLEAANVLRGHFSPDLMFNKPVFKADAPTHHKACDRMPGGKCTYASRPHEHIVGVGIRGAEAAYRAYPGLHIIAERPTIVDEGDKLYWACKITVKNLNTDSQLEKWYMESVMLKTKKGDQIEKESGAMIAQSKAFRNAVLASIDHSVILGWIEDYLDGKQPFSTTNAQSAASKPKPAQETKKSEPKPVQKQENISNVVGNVGPPVKFMMNNDTLELVKKYASMNPDLPEDKIKAWCLSKYNTSGQCMLNINRAINNEANIKDEIVDFILKLEAEENADKGEVHGE